MKENESIQYSLGYQDGFLDAKKQFERAKGEWIYKTKPDSIGWWYCSNCCERKEWIGKNSNFCSNCGANMRKGGAE